ncbi:MAG: helix-turn-helix domain-containing protein [Spirochaetaceae bacterium]|jgi:transcriptional regulator with XRE-family HTH domain|nr:helix-turn-helix domain-containing protein [Spirochaetaceae bacterium]
MNSDQLDLRRALSANIKNRRSILGITQEKLAEKAEISVNMVGDIEGCRTWVSDKTLIRLAVVLKTEVWSLFLPGTPQSNENTAISEFEFAHELQNIKRNFDIQFENALKARGITGVTLSENPHKL